MVQYGCKAKFIEIKTNRHTLYQDNFLNANEAKDYGIVDDILTMRDA